MAEQAIYTAVYYSKLLLVAICGYFTETECESISPHNAE